MLFGQAGLEVEGQREAHAVLAGLVTRLVEQGTGLADIEGIGFHRLFIEGAAGIRGRWTRGQAAVELVDDERAVDGVVDGLLTRTSASSGLRRLNSSQLCAPMPS